MTIKAPFNFVPISSEVFMPDWAKDVSHDIPFEDGESGEIELTIKAETPIFVRNGHIQERDESFSHIDVNEVGRKYFIPGTSLKGMIRSVLEIMSFSRMNMISNSRYAFRDLNSPDYTLKGDQENIKCGWLTCAQGKYKITNCEEPVWFSHAKMDELLKTEFVEAFKTTDCSNPKYLANECKTAQYKYEVLLRGKNLDLCFDKHKIHGKFYMTDGSTPGRIVVTGQPMYRDGKKGKFKEFVFPVATSNHQQIEISETLWDEFLFQYYDSDPNKMSKDWRYWKAKLRQGEPVPVFFRIDEKGGIKDFGLTFLYKLPYKHTVKSVLDKMYSEHNNKGYDLGELIFGCTNNNALKGRVHVGHAVLVGDARACPRITGILGSPKASYYPIYLQQNGSNGFLPEKENCRYITYMSDDARLSGWKRYLVQRVPTRLNSNKNENMQIAFTPLASGTRFKCKIRVHNLKKVEIGALLSAITFHNRPECYHLLGMAKPYGYGKISCSVKLNHLQFEAIEYMKTFEKLMSQFLKTPWCQTEQVSELMKMASLNILLENPYMALKDHAKVKGSNDKRLGKWRASEYLQKASIIYADKEDKPINRK